MYKGESPQNSTWEFFYMLVGNKKYAKCKKSGHQRANYAVRMRVHYTKYSTDSSSIPQPVVIARDKGARSRSPPCKRHDVEIQGDIDSHVVKTSATFKSALDIEIMKLFYACSL